MTDTISKKWVSVLLFPMGKKEQIFLNLCVFSKHSVQKGTLPCKKNKVQSHTKNMFQNQIV